MTAIMREILRNDEYVDEPHPDVERIHQNLEHEQEPVSPTPRFDFDESSDVCYHNGIAIPRDECPEHSDEAQRPVSAEELDDITGETTEEENPMIARARRLAQQQNRQHSERLFPEEIPMSGAGPPPDIPPNMVV